MEQRPDSDLSWRDLIGAVFIFLAVIGFLQVFRRIEESLGP